MIRFVVPTMWNYLPFWDFAKHIVNVDVVSELFIINNDPDKTPDLEILKHPKVKMVSFGKNIGVNPAWNCGAMGSKSDIICISNDDIIFDTKVFYEVSQFLTDKIGILGLSERRPERNEYPVNTGQIEFTPFELGKTDRYGYGVLYFIHKNNWKDIPHQLLMFYGDNFVFDQCFYRGLQNYMIDNLFHYHAGAKTTSIITDYGRKDNIYIDKEESFYNQEIVPRFLAGNFDF